MSQVRRNPLWRRGAPVFAVLLPTIVTAVHAAAYGRWIVDDAGITFAYARSVTSGAGPVLQAGGPVVEGYSDPAWLAVLGIGRLAGLFDRGAWFGVPDYVLFPKGVALLCCAGVFVAWYRIATAVSRLAWQHRVFAVVELHRLAYYEVRAQVAGLGAQAAVRAIARVAGAYANRRASNVQHLAVAGIALNEHADRIALRAHRDDARRGADSALETEADHAGSAPDIALRD